MTKLERTKQFIKDTIYTKGICYNWQIEEWASEQKKLGFFIEPSSASKYGRILRVRGEFDHPTQDGKVNEHAYVLAEKILPIKPVVVDIPDKLFTGLLKNKHLTLF